MLKMSATFCRALLIPTAKSTFSRLITANNIAHPNLCRNFTSDRYPNCIYFNNSYLKCLISTSSVISGYVCGTSVISTRQMAGHAKWQNVKHIKATKDKEKSKLCDRYCRLVRMAVREKGPDPKINTKLADIINEAHRYNVPNATLESAMKKGASGKTKFGTIELYGPGGCFIILDYETDNISNARHEIKNILKKYGFTIPQGEGRWRAVFEQKGILKVVGMTDGGSLDADKALDSAIEAGAEDVQLKVDEEEEEKRTYLEFFSAPEDLHSVKKELEKLSYKIEEAYVAFIPNVTVKLSEEDLQKAGNLLSELEEHQDIVRIYENIQ